MGNWGNYIQYRYLCYTDILPLYATEQLSGGRLPYLDACQHVPGERCDEYPPVTMYVMRAAASLGGGSKTGCGNWGHHRLGSRSPNPMSPPSRYSPLPFPGRLRCSRLRSSNLPFSSR